MPGASGREVDWVPIPDPAGYLSLTTTRGYTGHEQLDPVGLIHMNGRVGACPRLDPRDPEIGRFVSADPVIQFPFNLQNLNRYSYVLNNPLSFTDPTGLYSVATGTDPYRDGSSLSSTTSSATNTTTQEEESDKYDYSLFYKSNSDSSGGVVVNNSATAALGGEQTDEDGRSTVINDDTSTTREMLLAQAGDAFCYECEAIRVFRPDLLGGGFEAIGGGFPADSPRLGPADAGLIGLGVGLAAGAVILKMQQSIDVNHGEALIPEVQNGATILNSEGKGEGCVYCVKGENTTSGKDYVGSTDDFQTRRRDKSDGRNRTRAEIIDRYPKGDTAARRTKEQKAINDRGGVANVDNKRNEIAPKYWEEIGVNPPRP